jgi:hypothetical protein
MMSAMRNAATPMMGGSICPPLEATASMAQAKSSRTPSVSWRSIACSSYRSKESFQRPCSS